ncbi:MAG TPA: EamA family transporter [Thermomicrobiales bacterium]|nr:EamA family transporter [Thermomicrobiales bacterium]
MGYRGTGGPRDKRRTEGLIAINVAAVIFGTAGLYGTIDASPFWIVAVRAAFAALALAIVAVARGQWRMPVRDLWRPLVVSGAILAVHWLSFFASVKLAGVALATVTVVSFPLFSVLIEAAQGRVRPRLSQVVAGIVIVLAVGTLTGADGSGDHRVLGVAVGLFSAVTFSLFGFASAALNRRMTPVMLSVGQNGVVALLVIPFLALPVADPAPTHARQWLLLVLLGVVTTATTHQLYFYAMQRLSPVACGGYMALEPVYTIIFAGLLLGEPVTPMIVLCAAMILAASIVLSRRGRGDEVAVLPELG